MANLTPPTQRWQKRHVLLWLLLAGLVCWWRGPAFRRAFEVEFYPPGHKLFLPDFFQEWASARNLFNGLPIYTPHEITIERYLGLRRPPKDPYFVEYNSHPPSSVILGIPFAGLPFADAFTLWNCLSLLCLAASAVIIVRCLDLPFVWWDLLPALTLLLLCHPFRHQMMHGQLNLVLLLMLTSAWAADRSGRPRWAGTLVGIAAAIKFFPGFLFLYFLLRRDWRAVRAGLIALAATTVVTGLILGPQTYRSYFGEVLPRMAHYRAGWQNLSLSGVWFKLFDVRKQFPPVKLHPIVEWPGVAVMGVAFTLLGVSAVLAWRLPRMLAAKEADLAFAVTMIGMLLVSPITWDHYLLLLALPLTLLWRSCPPGGLGREVLMSLVALLCIPLGMVVEHGLILLDAAHPRNAPGQWLATPLETLTAVTVPCYLVVAFFVLALCTAGGHRPAASAVSDRHAPA